jgi:hypothetical protein
MGEVKHRGRQGIVLSLGYSVCYLGFRLLIPVAVCFLKLRWLPGMYFCDTVWDEHTRWC